MFEKVLVAVDGLVVMGSRGLPDVEGLLLGSVTQEVLQHADRPVLVVR